MKKQALSLAAIIAGACPAVSHALSLGDIDSNSSLGQPLQAQIELLSTTPEEARQLKVRLAPRNVFSRVGIERPRFLDNIRFQSTLDGQGKPVIAVSSNEPISEPFVNFLLEVSWPQGQLLKEYTVLLNPPVLLQPGNTVSGREAGVRPEPTSAGRVNRPDSSTNRNQANNANTPSSAPRQVASRPVGGASQPASAPSANNRQASRQPTQVAERPRRTTPTPPARTRANNGTSRVYRVRSGDTLLEVANRVRRQTGANADQMMMALLRANPDAFINNNINALKAGVTLQIPPANDARRVSSAEARRQVRQQYTDWRKFRSTLAQNTVPQESSGSGTNRRNNNTQRGSNNNSASRPSQSTRNTSNPRVEIVGDNNPSSSGNAAGSGRTKELENQLDLAKEALSTANRKNSDLDSRVKQLESLVAQKERVLELRNAELSRLKQQLSTSRATPEEAPESRQRLSTNQANITNNTPETETAGNIADFVPNPVVPQFQGGGVTQNEVRSPLESNLERKAALTEPRENEGRRTDRITGQVDTETQEETTQSPFRDSQAAGTDFLSLLTSPTAWTIGAGSLASLLFLWLLSRFFGRRRAEPVREDEPLGHYDAMNDAEPPLRDNQHALDRNNFQDLEAQLDQAEKNDRFDDPFGVESLDEKTTTTATTRSLQDNPGAAVANDADQEEDEVLMESNVYIAYGLHQQAESELQKALDKHPERLEYRHKLLENYFSANNRDAFDQQAQAFLDTRGSQRDSKMWQDIQTWGNKISPDNPLYRDQAVSGPGVGAAVTAAGAAIAGGAAAAVSGLGDRNNTNEVNDLHRPPPLPDHGHEPFGEELNTGSSHSLTGKPLDVDQALSDLDGQDSGFNKDFDFGLDDLQQDLGSASERAHAAADNLANDGKDMLNDMGHGLQGGVDKLEDSARNGLESAQQVITERTAALKSDAQDNFDDTFDFTLDDLSADPVLDDKNTLLGNAPTSGTRETLNDIEDLGDTFDRELDYTLDDLSTDLQQEASQAGSHHENQPSHSSNHSVNNNDFDDFGLNELPADPQDNQTQLTASTERSQSVSANADSNEMDIEPLDFDSLLGDEPQRTEGSDSPRNPSRDNDSSGSGLGGMMAAAGAAAAGAATAAAAGLLGKKDQQQTTQQDAVDLNDLTFLDEPIDDSGHGSGQRTQGEAPSAPHHKPNHADSEIDDLLQFDDGEMNFDLPMLDEQDQLPQDDKTSVNFMADAPQTDKSDELGLGQELEQVGRALDKKVDNTVDNVTNLNLHLDKDSGLQKILPDDTPYTRQVTDDAPIDKDEWLGDIDDALSFLDAPDDDIDLHEAHISTKLDLARAYLDMGDIEGARSTLEEVMVEGNDNQRREAETLLHQTG